VAAENALNKIDGIASLTIEEIIKQALRLI
jgi:hypothetical protein